METLSRLIAFLILIFLSPVILLVSILSLLFQGFPIFFKQSRVGYKYKTFKIYKFRTMILNSGDLITNENDDRITFIKTDGEVIEEIKNDSQLSYAINLLANLPTV